MDVEKIELHGWKNCYRIQFQNLQCIVTSDVGPRIISLRRLAYASSGPVEMKELMGLSQQDLGQVGGPEWRLYGGHRLWSAPEMSPRTYFPDNGPVSIEVSSDNLRVKITAPSELENSLRKTIEISGIMHRPDAPGLQVLHTIENVGRWPFEVAPWAITVMGAHTTAVIPLSHDDPSGLLPKTSVSLWNYTKLVDSRLKLGNRYIIVEQQPTASTTNKIGARVNNGWTCAANTDTLFVKLIDKDTSGLKVDLGANVECYLSPDILELETVAPLTLVEPGKQVTLTEKWFLFENSIMPTNDQAVDELIVPIINRLL